MKTETDYSKIIPDYQNIITKWVCDGLNIDYQWIKNYQTFGVVYQDKIIAGLIFHDVNYGHDVWWTIYSTNKHWCNRRVLKQFFREAFNVLHCQRINLLIDADNDAALKFVTRLGFKIEGRLRKYRNNGRDCYILGLLQSENKYL